jgi:hypothetical protein
MNVTVGPLFENHEKTIHYSSLEDAEVVLVFERNNVGLKELSQVLSEQTSDSSAFLNAMCLIQYVLNCEQHSSFSVFRSGLTVTGLPGVSVG